MVLRFRCYLPSRHSLTLLSRGILLLLQLLSVTVSYFPLLPLAPQSFILPYVLIMFWFTIDNNCFIEFDPTGCSVKDLLSQNVIVRCNSSGPLYPLRLPAEHSLVAASGSSLWHRRLGHPGREVLSRLRRLACPTIVMIIAPLFVMHIS